MSISLYNLTVSNLKRKLRNQFCSQWNQKKKKKKTEEEASKELYTESYKMLLKGIKIQINGKHPVFIDWRLNIAKICTLHHVIC